MTLQSVDCLDIQVLVDNVTDMLSQTPAFVTREAAVLRRHGMKRTSGPALCCANHGLALVLTLHRGASRRSFLFDGGPDPYAIERNGPKLGVQFGAIEAAMLSHGHWDHAGGIPKALEFITASNGGRKVPLHLHPGMFRERGLRQPDGGVFPMDHVPKPAEWEAMGAAPVVTDRPQSLFGDTLWISGEIPRRTPYERGLPGQVARATEADAWESDELLMDERFCAVHVRGRGLVVFSACSHAGIVNVLHAARESFPDVPLFAVMGGFHLSGENEAIIPQTVADLAQFDLPLVIPAHCTGWRAVNALERAFGERVVPAAVGKLFTLDAA
jgi:7,8-dihydropterin-6-yl-methyl-4-(beta-D-ribofuranosyl)aminobenzene 5'-phosphate synthase